MQTTSTSTWSEEDKEREVRRKMCGRKTKFKTYREAMGSARYAVRNGTTTKRGVSAYECPFCGRFHWGNVDR